LRKQKINDHKEQKEQKVLQQQHQLAEKKSNVETDCHLDCGGPSPGYPCSNPNQRCAVRDLDKYPNAYGFCIPDYESWTNACQPVTCPPVVCDESTQHYKFMNQACCVECKSGRGKRWDEEHPDPAPNSPYTQLDQPPATSVPTTTQPL